MYTYVLFFCAVLFNTIVVLKSWPYESRRANTGTQPPQLRNDLGSGSHAQSNFHRRDVPDNERRAKGDADDDDIVFPGAMSIGPKIATDRNDFSAQGKGFECVDKVCAKAKDYPYDHIKNLLRNVSLYENLFGHVDGTFVDQGTRGGADEPEAKALCTSTVLTMFPQTLENEKKVEKYIVNDGKYKQGVIFERCVQNAHCGEAFFPADYVSECTQKYSTRRLLAVEKEKEKEPVFDSFVVPSCCVCTIKQVKKQGA